MSDDFDLFIYPFFTIPLGVNAIDILELSIKSDLSNIVDKFKPDPIFI